MKQVIFVPQLEKEPTEKPIELTNRKMNGWNSVSSHYEKQYLKQATKVVYLGRCEQDGDMFALYINKFIMIFKGKLNSGKY